MTHPGKPPHSTRDALLEAAGITIEEQVKRVKESWDRKVELMSATKKHYVNWDGKVRDERIYPDNRTRLQACDAIDRQTGVIAPKATQKVEIVHRVEFPDWALPDGTPSQVIELQANVEKEPDSDVSHALPEAPGTGESD